jgi:hypothetical protein
MIILTPTERETVQVFFKESSRAELPWFAARKHPYHRCCDSGRPWYADKRVGWNGLSYRCLLYNQKWTHWASIKKKMVQLSVFQCNESWYPLRNLFTANFFRRFTELWITPVHKANCFHHPHTERVSFHGNLKQICQDHVLLGYNAVQCGRYVKMLRRYRLTKYSG